MSILLPKLYCGQWKANCEFEKILACDPENRGIRNVLRDYLSSHIPDVVGMMGDSRYCLRNSETGRQYGLESVTARSSSTIRKSKVYGTRK